MDRVKLINDWWRQECERICYYTPLTPDVLKVYEEIAIEEDNNWLIERWEEINT